MYYEIKIWGFLTLPPVSFVITFSTERNQKLQNELVSSICFYKNHKDT